jgi:multimeric flavodoxin WrbA
MRIVVLHGQIHHGVTWHLLQALLAGLQAPDDSLQEFTLNNLPSCTGCFTCFKVDEARCPHRAQYGRIIEAIEAADIVIATSPTYCMEMSGQLKTFFDHMAYRWAPHRPHPAMWNKVGIAISSTVGAGAGNVVRSIARQFMWWLIPRRYTLALALQAANWAEVAPEKQVRAARQAEALGRKIRQRGLPKRMGLLQRLIHFGIGMGVRSGKWLARDTEYWLAQGWVRSVKCKGAG